MRCVYYADIGVGKERLCAQHKYEVLGTMHLPFAHMH